MPISNGKDRSNYTTTTNFSMIKRASVNPVKRNNSVAVEHKDPVRQQVNRYLALQESPRMPIDSSYVYIPDQRLREIVQKLIISEQDRISNNIDPNLITQINHRGYSLFFSRTGFNLFDKKQLKVNSENLTTDPNLPTQTPTEKSQDDKIDEPIRYLNESSVPQTNEITDIQWNDQNNSVYKERAQTMLFNHVVTINDQIPPIVNQAIQQDLEKNPLNGSERSYKIVLNNKTPGKEQRIIKVLVKSQNHQKLPKIQTNYIIHQKPKYLKFIESEELASNQSTVVLNSRNSKEYDSP